MTARLAAGVEAAALLRRVDSLGGHGAVLHRGDAERGSLLLAINQRGCHVALLERLLDPDGEYRWHRSGPTEQTEQGDSQAIAQHLERRRRIDSDIWIIELDIVPAERFIAETIAQG